MEEQRSVSVDGYGRQAHAENPFLPPLEIQAADIVVAGQRVGHEVTVSYSPRSVLFPRVNDQSVSELVGHVGERVVATTFPQIDGNVGDKRILFDRKDRLKRTSIKLENSYIFLFKVTIIS